MYNQKEGVMNGNPVKKGANFSTLFTWLQLAAAGSLNQSTFGRLK